MGLVRALVVLGRIVELILGEGRVSDELAVLVLDDLQIVEGDRHRLLADLEETADIDHDRIDLAVLGNDDIADAADVLVVRIVDSGTVQIVGADLVASTVAPLSGLFATTP